MPAIGTFMLTVLLLAAAASATQSIDVDLEGIARSLLADTDASLNLGEKGSAMATKALRLAAAAVRHPDIALPSWLPANIVDAIRAVRLDLGEQNKLGDDAAVVDALLAARSTLAPAAAGDDTSSKFPYFGFLPKFVGTSIPHTPTSPGSDVVGSTQCFGSLKFSTSMDANASQLVFNLAMEQQRSFLCTDTLVVATPGMFIKILTVDSDKAALSWKWNMTSDSAYTWYSTTKGVKLFRLNKGIIGAILDMVDTVKLMAGFGECPVKAASLAASFDFMTNYIQRSPRMKPMSVKRPAGSIVADTLDESYVRSGDSVIVVRYDGLDPMIGWGEGFSAGHSTIAVRDPECVKQGGTECLSIYESTAKGSYWPVNGIQKTPWKKWLATAKHAGFNILLAPLSPEHSAAFNATTAIAFFEENKGFNYGYLNFLFGWIDQRNDNFPCLPPNYEYCLGREMFDVFSITLDNLLAGTADNIVRQSMNFRTGTTDLPIANVMRHAYEKLGRKEWSETYTMPELDEWRYQTMRDGKPAVGRSMVCCVFVCNMWKHGGIFKSIGDDINCGEQTLWDIYSMKVFDPKKLGDGRPEICRKTDPTNPMCQLLGDYTFHATPDFNTRSLYKDMGQNCSSIAPNYVRAPGC
jgi:hypothetical protein